jgi:hypothetical protein
MLSRKRLSIWTDAYASPPTGLRAQHKGFEFLSKPRVVTKSALLCDHLQGQAGLCLNSPLSFSHAQLPKCDICRNATVIEKAALQGSSSNPKLVRQIAFAQSDRKCCQYQFFRFAHQKCRWQDGSIDTPTAR